METKKFTSATQKVFRPSNIILRIQRQRTTNATEKQSLGVKPVLEQLAMDQFEWIRNLQHIPAC